MKTLRRIRARTVRAVEMEKNANLLAPKEEGK